MITTRADSLTAAAAGTQASVYARLRRAILRCELRPGSVVYEQELAAHYEVSKSPVREALLVLRQQHLVDVRPRRGYVVRPISLSEAQEMYEMRDLYEGACVMRAIDTASDETLQALMHVGRDPEAGLEGWVDANRAFHIALTQASGSRRLMQPSAELIEQFDRLTYASASSLAEPLDVSRFIGEHRTLVQAMQARDKRLAKRLIRDHVEHSRLRTLSALGSLAVVP